MLNYFNFKYIKPKKLEIHIYMNKKNLLTKVLVLFGMLFVSTYAFADYQDSSCQPKDCCQPKECCCPEPCPGPFAFAYPKDVGLCCPKDFYLYADFLLMYTSEEGLNYAMKQTSTDSNGTSSFPLVSGEVKGFRDWAWKPGFRAGFGFYLCHDAWMTDFNWTYVRLDKSSSVSTDVGTLLPLFLPPNSVLILPGAPADLAIPSASAEWKGNYNTADFMLGKPYHVSRYYISTPMFGIRGAWINQDFRVRYNINGSDFPVFGDNDFWGIGLRGAYEGNFLMGCGWSFYGKAAFSLLFGKFDVSQHSDVVLTGPNANKYNYKDSQEFFTVQPNAELGLGIAWSKFFCKHRYKGTIKLGYEFHEWWNLNNLRRFFDENPVANDIVSRGDLCLNGLQFGLLFDF